MTKAYRAAVRARVIYESTSENGTDSTGRRSVGANTDQPFRDHRKRTLEGLAVSMKRGEDVLTLLILRQSGQP